MNIDLEHIGGDLAKIRAAAGLTQAVVSKKTNLDASRLSRIEAGEVPPNEAEVTRIANAIASPLAEEYIAFCQQGWSCIPKPIFWNPDRESLFVADEHLRSLSDWEATVANIPPSSAAQVELYKSALKCPADFLSRLDHSIACVGEIGVGKSAAICGITGLILPDNPSAPIALSKRTVLEVAAGRTTLCEVALRSGPEHNFGLSVVPSSQEEVYRIASDFCASSVDVSATKSVNDNSSETRGVPEEVAKALRNMSEMTRTTTKDKEGRVLARHDPLSVLIASLNGALPEVTAELVKRMRLEQRTSTEFSFQDEDFARGLGRLRDLFAQINKGQHREVTLPKRIELTVPVTLLDSLSLNIRVIDTKGIDETALRPDIRQHLDDSRTVTVLCSRFNSAPDSSVRETLENLVETGAGRIVSERIATLILARTTEVLDTQDDEGNRAENSEEGYRLKSDQVRAAFAKIKGAEHVPIYFYNVLLDKADKLASALLDQVKSVRARHALQIKEVSQAVRAFVESFQKEGAEKANTEVRQRLRVFLQGHTQLPPRVQSPHALFINTLGSKHARTVWATTRRNGAWGGLHAYHLIGLGAASDAQQRCQITFSELDLLLTTLLGEPPLKAARDYLLELRRAAVSWKEKFVSEASGNGREISRAVLFDDDPIWNACEQLWGGGFRSAVSTKLQDWFKAHPTLFELIEKRMSDAWKVSFVTPLTDLVGTTETSI